MKTLSSKPVHVDSDDDDLLARVAAIDVAKDSGMACTRVPDESRPGKQAGHTCVEHSGPDQLRWEPGLPGTSEQA